MAASRQRIMLLALCIVATLRTTRRVSVPGFTEGKWWKILTSPWKSWETQCLIIQGGPIAVINGVKLAPISRVITPVTYLYGHWQGLYNLLYSFSYFCFLFVPLRGPSPISLGTLERLFETSSSRPCRYWQNISEWMGFFLGNVQHEDASFQGLSTGVSATLPGSRSEGCFSGDHWRPPIYLWLENWKLR